MISSGKTGLLVPPRDPQALGEAIARLLTDHPLADTLARAGHNFVVANFSIEAMLDEVTRIYEEGAQVAARRSGTTRTAA